MTSYNTYKMRVSRSDRLFSCESVSRKPTDHAKHVYEDHGLNKKTHCPWCRQPFDTGFKGVAMNVSHLSECFDRLENLKDAESSEDVDEEPSIMEPKDTEPKDTEPCKACMEFDSLKERCQFYGRSRLDHPTFYEPFEQESFEQESFEHRVRFTDASGLGDDVARYIGLEGYVFVHFFVKLNAFDSFTEAMRDSRSVRLLPFSCLCDGGNCKEDEYRIHRHGIAVCRQLKDFTDMFRRVGFTMRKYKDQKCKSYVKIGSRHHLCNTINYVSGRKSGCTGKSLHRGKKKKSNKKNHYHIFRPLCLHANLFLHACYDAGPQEYYEQLHGNRDVWDKEVKWEDGKAYILVSGDGCRPPLAPDLFETEEATVGSFVGLWKLEGRPIYLTRSRSVYRDSQVDLRFFLTNSQTRRARELTMDRKVRQARHEEEKQAMCTKKDQKIEELRSEIETLRTANANLHKEWDFKLQLKDLEIKNLKDKSKSEVGHAREISALKTSHYEHLDKVKATHDEEIKSLRAEKDAEIKIVTEKKDAEIEKLHADIKQLYKELQEKDAEIKQLLVDQLAATVNRNLEDVNLREENRRSLIEHHAEIVRLMEEKMELKDKICALFERVVCTWLADSKKRKLCTN